MVKEIKYNRTVGKFRYYLNHLHIEKHGDLTELTQTIYRDGPDSFWLISSSGAFQINYAKFKHWEQFCAFQINYAKFKHWEQFFTREDIVKIISDELNVDNIEIKLRNVL